MMLPLLQTRLHHMVINIRLLKHRKHPELLAMFIRLVEHLVKVGIQRVTKKSLLRHVDLSNGIQRVTKKSVFRHVDLDDGIQKKSFLPHVDLDDGIQKKSFLPHVDLDDGIQSDEEERSSSRRSRRCNSESDEERPSSLTPQQYTSSPLQRNAPTTPSMHSGSYRFPGAPTPQGHSMFAGVVCVTNVRITTTLYKIVHTPIPQPTILLAKQLHIGLPTVLSQAIPFE